MILSTQQFSRTDQQTPGAVRGITELKQGARTEQGRQFINRLHAQQIRLILFCWAFYLSFGGVEREKK